MGMFGEDKKRKFNWGRAALSIFAPEAAHNLNKRDSLREQARAEADNKRQVYEALIKRGMSPDEAIIAVQNLEAAGKATSELFTENRKARQFGAEGGSVATVGADGQYRTGYTAPSWQDGSLFGSTGGGNAKPDVLVEREKVIPIEAGGAAVGVKPYSGEARPVVAPNTGGAQFGQPVGNLPQVTDEASYNAVPPGAQYRDPDGNIRTKAGGGVGNGTSGFR